jgi:hypothetical protein
MNEQDELDKLIAELAKTPAERDALLEEHRQLEKDLLRLADPPPPPDFVSKVMAKVAAQPKTFTRAETIGAASLVTALLAVGLMFLSPGNSSVGVVVAQAVIAVRGWMVGFGSALEAVWATAALPLSVSLLLTLVSCLFALRRLVAAAPSEAKVVT